MAKKKAQNKPAKATQPVVKTETVDTQPQVQNTPVEQNAGSGEINNCGGVQGEQSQTQQKVDDKLKYKAVVVRTPGGLDHRIYSLEDHGKDFEKLAEEFCEGHEGYSYAPYEEKKVVVPTKEELARVDVIDRWGGVHRTYSLQEHGESYQCLAEEFCKSNKGFTFKVR